MSGCNYAAKNTVLMNYLPDARNHGAKIFTRVAVRFVQRKDDRWLVHYQVLDTGRERFDAPPLFVSADIVVLAAGALGSTEILLRSADNGLPLSDHVGLRLTGNGDVLAFSYNSDREVNGIGWGHRNNGEVGPVGPCITGIIDDRDQSDLEQGMVIEEGSIPGALADCLPESLAAVARTSGIDIDRGLQDRIQEIARELDSLVLGPYRGAVRNTQTYLVMSHDDGNGEAVLDGDRLRIHWPDVGSQPLFERISKALQRAIKALGGTYLTSPIWNKLLGQRLVTVHPLGGCVMAEDAERGVVNHRGQVFAGPQGSAFHEGLYVSDGSVIPRPLGVNPLLTISALAERCCALLAQDRGWTIDYTLPSVPPAPAPPRALGIQFSETMTGYISTQITDDYQAATDRGKADGSAFSFTLTIISDDLDRMLADPKSQARMIGTVRWRPVRRLRRCGPLARSASPSRSRSSMAPRTPASSRRARSRRWTCWRSATARTCTGATSSPATAISTACSASAPLSTCIPSSSSTWKRPGRTKGANSGRTYRPGDVVVSRSSQPIRMTFAASIPSSTSSRSELT